MAIPESHQVFYLILVRIDSIAGQAMDGLREGICLLLLKTTTRKAPVLIEACGCQPYESGVYKHPSA